MLGVQGRILKGQPPLLLHGFIGVQANSKEAGQ